MLVNWLLLLSACFFCAESYYNDYTQKDSDYKELLQLLYKRYVQLKRDQVLLNRNDLEDNPDQTKHDSTFHKRSYIPYRDVTGRIHEYGDRAASKRSVGSSRRGRVAKHKATKVSDGKKSVSGAKRDTVVQLHVVTPVHDDDIKENTGSKRGLLPEMDLITPVHDDEMDAAAAASAAAASAAAAAAAQKNIVPVHDDDDNRITNNAFNREVVNRELTDDMKTFITVVEKTKQGTDDSDEGRDNALKEVESFHTDEENLNTDGTFNIRNMNNQREENVVEVESATGRTTGTSQASHHNEGTTSVHRLLMPGVVPKHRDTYLCYAHKLPVEDRYIVEYRPLADKQTAHHMLLFACDEPFQKNDTWSCREMSPVCKHGGQTIMYAWAMNAPSLKMPTNVGFHVGGETGFKYLVLQVHYLHVSKFKGGHVKDHSGLEFVLDKSNKRYLAGIYLLADGFTPIPPHKNRSHIDMGCLYSVGPVFFPFRFRVHAHKLGVVITGYRVRNGNWTLIGRGDPQRPQAFYSVFHDIDIKAGDAIMGRCTYNSTTRNGTTLIGPTHTDEMCNFYIMYFYDSYLSRGRSGDSFPCEEVTSQEIYNTYPEDSDIALSVMEEANRIKFAHYGVKDLSYVPVKNWPSDGDILYDGDTPLNIGQISGVSMVPSDTQVVILHRADRYWGGGTFNWKNIVTKKYQTSIDDDTMVWLDRKTGDVIKSRGKGLFYLPHGITIDRKGYIWVTDVGAHQVYKLSRELKVLMTLGEKFLPGSGYKRFCKPTDVAVMPNGDFFVGDGYCNNRVVKFNSDGVMLLQISADRNPNVGLFPKPNFMSVVHSLSLDNVGKRLFVADRENGRILIFHSGSGIFMEEIKVPQGAVYAVAYNPNQGGVLHFVTGPLSDKPVTLSGYTYSFISNSVVSLWAPEGGFTLPHDLSVSKDNLDTFVVEINPFKVWKFTQKTKSPK